MAQPPVKFYKSLFSGMAPGDFPARFLAMLLEQQGVDRGSVWVAEEQGYRCIEAAGDESEKIKSLVLERGKPSIVAWVIENKKMTVSEVASDQRQAKDIEKGLAVKNNVILCFPLILDSGEVYGAVEIIDASAQGDRLNLDDDYLNLLQSLVGIGAIALGNALTLEGHQKENRRLKWALAQSGSGEIVSQSPAFLQAVKTARSYAQTDFPVLITGESGTGKDLVASEIHRLSRRNEGPFLAQNCSAIPETLLESELFGYKKGAFTGADRDKTGLFQAANGGTLFLDEIGDMPLSLQARLLRVLQNAEVKPLGGTATKKVDVRVIAATNRDLDQAISQKEFRQDLYYRLNVLPLELPPLRQRPEDVGLLLGFFMKREAALMQTVPKKFSGQALEQLSTHAWPGNIRELENLVKFLLATVEGDEVETLHLPHHLTGGQCAPTAEAPESGEDLGPAGFDGMSWEELERAYAEHLLEKHRWNITKAAAEAAVNRSTFNSRLAKLGLKKEA